MAAAKVSSLLRDIGGHFDASGLVYSLTQVFVRRDDA